jgi:hypothetical protein
VSSRRHEQAERQAVEQAVTDYVKLGGVILLICGICFVLGGPWVEWNRYGHQWGWAVLGVFDDLVGAAVAVAFIAVKISESKSKAVRPKTSGPAIPAATAEVNHIALAFEARAQRVAASTIELRDIDNSMLRARVKNIREERGWR